MTFEPTDEQKAIVEAAKTTTDNLLINALAGAAKTTTLELICKALPFTPILSLAFNKRIADEMKLRLPGNVKAATVNSIGHGVWQSHVKRKLGLNDDKMYELMKIVIDELPKSQKWQARAVFADTLKAAKAAKMQGYIPDGSFPDANHLIKREDFIDDLEDEIDVFVLDETLRRSITAAFAGAIDFNDQIYMPTLFNGVFPQFPLVCVDEAQDLSPLNHAMLDKLVSTRIIAVGDPWQSIYAFRGADTNSMRRLKVRFNCKEMTLSMSFRCPIEVVKVAHKRVPHMKWAPWAKEGRVSAPEEWSASTLPDGAAIICRNNAPLFKCALELLKLGRGVKLVGTDLGPSLIRTMKKLGPESMTREQTMAAIQQWQEEMSKKRKRKGAIADKADCLRVFAGFGETLSAAIAYAEHLFQANGPILLMSGHKAKGLEYDHVFFLNPGLIPSIWAESPEELDQEENIRYVIETRAKSELTMVTLEGLRP